jgi:hypothetical protein
LFPGEARVFQASLNEMVYHCLQQKRWKFVAELHDFVLSEPLKKDLSEIDLKIRVINSAIGVKFSGDAQGARRLLESVDWTASIREFKLATVVLQDKYSEAVEIMKSIGKDGEIIHQSCYHSWPLFVEFRKQPDFYKAYADVYGEPFSETVQTTSGDVQALATGPKIPAEQRDSAVAPNDATQLSSKAVPRKRAKAGAKKTSVIAKKG